MVFGAIQRFFPDFFPSCFTERRQNLLSLYESTEYSEVTIDESWNEKLARVASAIAFFISSNLQKAYAALMENYGQIGEDRPKLPESSGQSLEDQEVNGKVNKDEKKVVNAKVNGKR